MSDKTVGLTGGAKSGYGIGSALITAFSITIPAMFILAVILTFTDFPEKYTTYAVLLATLAGLFTAGFKAGLHNEKDGIIKGGLTGLLYMLILYLLSSILFKDFLINQRSLIMIIVGILSGVIGGLFSSNRRARPKGRGGYKSKFPDPIKKYRK